MNILQLSPQYPFHESDGGQKGIVMFFNGFRQSGADITFVCYNNQPELLQNIPENVFVIQHSTKNSFFRKLLSVFDTKALYLRKHYSNSLFEKIKKILLKKRFDIIHADHTAMAEMAIALGAHYNIPVVLRLHNVEWKIWERYYQRLSKFNVAYYYIKRQTTLLKKMEINLCESVDVCLTISQNDKELLQQYVHTSLIETKPFGVNTVNQTRDLSHNYKEQYTLLMATNWAWRHNVEGAEWFIEHVLPLLQNSEANIKLLLLGKHLPKNFLKYSDNNVESIGFVEKISDYYNRASLFVSPLFVGSGIRIKILESLSFGVPVIATSIGAEGIELSESDGLFVSDDPQKQASTILDLLHNPNEIKRLGDIAIRSVEKKYNKQTIINETLDIYHKTIEQFTLQ